MDNLIFETVSGDSVMLPVANTSFVEKIRGDCSVYVIANHDGKSFELNTSLQEIRRLVTGKISTDFETKGFSVS